MTELKGAFYANYGALLRRGSAPAWAAVTKMAICLFPAKPAPMTNRRSRMWVSQAFDTAFAVL